MGFRAAERLPCTARWVSIGHDDRDDEPLRCAVAGETRLSWRFRGAMFGEACMRKDGDSCAGDGGCRFASSLRGDLCAGACMTGMRCAQAACVVPKKASAQPAIAAWVGARLCCFLR